jgi:carbon monoxide dehydrogenase subunit G
MIELIRRTFTVDAPLAAAWQHLAEVERWPSWATHIKHVELAPKGELTLRSKGSFHLKNGITSQFRMTEIKPPHSWTWGGPFLWLTVHYDHLFEAVDGHHTRLTWVVGAEGFGVAVFGRLFAAIYNRNLDRAIPHLIDEIKAPNVRP